jgi:biotin synthase
MPNLSPLAVRKKYELYDNKICTNEEAAECRHCLNKRITSIGFNLVTHIGNVKDKKDHKQITQQPTQTINFADVAVHERSK